MKRSMIAVCLLLLSPSEVIACFEDHNAGAGWFDQQIGRMVRLRKRCAGDANGTS